MTSSVGGNECYVYIVPPGETEFVAAAKFELTTNRIDIHTGRRVYGRSYLARSNAVPIGPLELKLNDRTYTTTALKGMFGPLRDASPDYWGRRVIERRFGKETLGEIDYLLSSPDDRAGALGFGLNPTPPAPRNRFNQTIQLDRLQAFADAIIADKFLPESVDAEQIQDLMLFGTSMGGARPKAVIEDEDGLWIAKFNRPDDKWNHARVEHSMLVLGRECGLHTSESRVVRNGDRFVACASTP